MRRILLLVFVISICSCVQNGNYSERQFEPGRIYPMSEFKTIQTAREMAQAVTYVEPGDKLPLKLNLSSEWLELEQKEVEVVAKRTIYLRIVLPDDISNEKMERLVSLDNQKLAAMNQAERDELFRGVMLYLSTDAMHWAAVVDKNTLKELFNIREGVISFGMGMNATEGLWADLSLKTSRKN